MVLTAAGQVAAGLRDGRGRHWQKHNELKKNDAMQAILRPVSHPQLGDLVIKDALFSIGRDIDAFARMPPALTARLSRRHARLFEQDGTLYIVDLGSRNGTFVNDKAVTTQPRALSSGDEIGFAGELVYRLDAPGIEPPRVTDASRPGDLQLVAKVTDNGPDSLVISAFPFLISKQADAFTKYQQRVPDELNYLSRRHAHIYQHDGRLLLEDLGSTNGTFVDARRLGDDPVELRDGQTVAFGGDYFVYRVALASADDATRVLAPSALDGVDAAADDKTTFVTAATSFLEIFCADAETPDQPDETADSVPATQGSGRPRTLFGQLVESFGGSVQRVALVVAAVLIVAAAGIFWAMQPSTMERLQALIEEHRYDDALALARGEQAAGESGSLISRLALRAMIEKTLPAWLEALDGTRFDDMASVLARARVPDEPLTAGREYLDLLAQIGEIAATLEARGGPDAPLRGFGDEADELGRLIDAWERPQPDQRQVSERVLAAISPEQTGLAQRFREVVGRTASQVRSLTARLAVYRPAQRQLSELVDSHLARGSLDRLAVEMEQLTDRYRQFSGSDLLLEDLSHYRATVATIEQGRLLEGARLLAETEFAVAPFATAAAQLARDRLPGEDFRNPYQTALDLWRRGEIDAARSRLEPLKAGKWQALAESELGRMERVATGFRELQALRGGDVYNDRLLEFYRALDSDRDRYFTQSLADEVAQARVSTTRLAEQAAAAAAQAWSAYGGRGGITSTQRLESRVGKDYVQHAAALSTAAAEAERARRAYALADAEIPLAQLGLLDAVAQEVTLQHQSLDELQGVLDDATLQEKRALLPGRARQTARRSRAAGASGVTGD